MPLLRSLFIVPLWSICFLVSIANTTQAQIIINYDADPSLTPFSVLDYQTNTYTTADVVRSKNFDIDTSSIEIEEEITSANLVFVNYLQAKQSLTYSGFRNETGIITETAPLLTRADLPTELYQERLGLTIPIPFGDNVLAINGGRTLGSDKKEVTDEDYLNNYSVVYSHASDANNRILFGVSQTQGFGLDVTFPLIGYQSSENVEWAVSYSFPTTLEVKYAPLPGWRVDFNYSDAGGLYRLTSKAPWESSIMLFSGQKTAFTLNYHLLGIVELSAEYGQITDQRIKVFGDKLTPTALSGADDTPETKSDIKQKLKLADQSYVGFRFAIAFGGPSGEPASQESSEEEAPTEEPAEGSEEETE